MKIGDKVRFLNDVGGGVVSGFQSKDIVIIRDADGFDIPTLARECVVVNTDNYNIARPTAEAPDAKQTRTAETADDDPADRPVTFRPAPVERRGADAINLYLGFVPADARRLPDTAFEAYVVNDSNYYIRLAVCRQEDGGLALWHEAEVEPNTKLFLEEFRHDALAAIERLSVQAFAYKRGRNFSAKPAYSLTLRVDGTKFYKLHTFGPTEFFEEPALLIDVVRDDRPARGVNVNAEQLKEAMTTPARSERPQRQPARVAAADDPKQPLVTDLHAAELLDTVAGLQPRDILDYQLKVFRETMDRHLCAKGRRLVFIHGKGEGVLRNALIRELKAHYGRCRYQDASFREYGFGATMVTIG